MKYKTMFGVYVCQRDHTARIVIDDLSKIGPQLTAAIYNGDGVEIINFNTVQEAYDNMYRSLPDLERINGDNGFHPEEVAFDYTDAEQAMHIAVGLNIKKDEILIDKISSYIIAASEPEDEISFLHLVSTCDDIADDENSVDLFLQVKAERDEFAKRLNQIAQNLQDIAGPDFCPFNKQVIEILKISGFYQKNN